MISRRLVVATAAILIFGGASMLPLGLLLTPETAKAEWWANYVASISSGLFGSAITFLTVVAIYESAIKTRERLYARKEQALETIASSRGDVVTERRSVELLRELGLLTDGSVATMSFSGMNLVGADFDGADLRGCDFSGADLTAATFIGARVDDCRFVRARLLQAVLEFSSAERADFRDAVV